MSLIEMELKSTRDGLPITEVGTFFSLSSQLSVIGIISQMGVIPMPIWGFVVICFCKLTSTQCSSEIQLRNP